MDKNFVNDEVKEISHTIEGVLLRQRIIVIVACSRSDALQVTGCLIHQLYPLHQHNLGTVVEPAQHALLLSRAAMLLDFCLRLADLLLLGLHICQFCTLGRLCLFNKHYFSLLSLRILPWFISEDTYLVFFTAADIFTSAGLEGAR